MPTLGKLLRTENWFSQKIPPLMAVGYALLLVGQIDPVAASRVIPFVFVSLCCVAAYGHMINDVFDIEADGRAGKRNLIAGVGPGQRRFMIVSLLLLATAGWAALPWNPASLCLLAVNCLLPTLYSAPPLRLKERGLMGVASDTLGSHVVPTLFTAVSVLGPNVVEQRLAGGLVLAAVGWALCLGVRGILIHQIIDQTGDRKANVQTFATLRRPKEIRSLVLKIILPIEAGCLIIFVALLAPHSNILIVAVVLYVAGEASRVARRVPFPLLYPRRPGLERHIPLVKNDFYEVWLPCALAIQLAVDQSGYLWLAAVHLLLFGKGISEVAQLIAQFARQQFCNVGIWRRIC